MRIKSDLRYELKYLIQREQMNALLPELREYMNTDPHGNNLGYYPITSLYYDTPDYKAYWDKLEGHRRRRKVRVRVYGNEQIQPGTTAFVEIKERVNSRIRKRRVALPYEHAVDFEEFDSLLISDQDTPPSVNRDDQGSDETESDTDELSQKDMAVIQELSYLYHTLQLQPSCVVHYDRMALEGREHYSDLRITFDTNVRGRAHDLSLLSTGHANDQLMLAPHYVILEVKANQTIPLWMANLLSRHQCTHKRISKYCTVLENCKVINARQRIVQTGHSRQLQPN